MMSGRWRKITAAVGTAELMLVVGTILITVALWPAIDRLALLPGGAILVWLALPARVAFIVRRERKRDD